MHNNEEYAVRIPRYLIFLTLLLLFTGPAQAETAPTEAAPAEKLLSAAELDDLVAPIALYPDALVAQILPASTLPLEIVEAARYVKEQGGKVTEVPDKGWDQSIIALLEVPMVLEMLNEKLSWTVQLGDAVFAQQNDVMDAVQRVRKAAQDAGKLESNDKQTVVVEKDVITVVQAQPEVIYVPTYYYVPSTTSTVTVYSAPDPYVSFTLGLIVGAAISNNHWHYHHIGWHSHHVYHHHRGYRGGRHWWKPSHRARTQHNARRNTAARRARGLPAGRGTNRPATRPSGQVGARQARGLPAGRGTGRPAKRPSGQVGARPSTRPASRPSSQAGARPSTRPASRPSGQAGARPSTQARPARQPATRSTNRSSSTRSSAFGGSRSSGRSTRMNSSRGFSSRGGGGGRARGGGRR